MNKHLVQRCVVKFVYVSHLRFANGKTIKYSFSVTCRLAQMRKKNCKFINFAISASGRCTSQ